MLRRPLFRGGMRGQEHLKVTLEPWRWNCTLYLTRGQYIEDLTATGEQTARTALKCPPNGLNEGQLE